MKLPFLRTQLFAIIFGINISQAITMRVGSPDDSRFVGNVPGATQNGSFQYGAYDFSGVGWDINATQKSITLISDTHFLAARHYQPSTDVRFRDTSGGIHDYTVSSYTTILNTDLVVGTLSTAVAGNVNFYPLLNPMMSPLGQNSLIYGSRGRVGESEIVSVQLLNALNRNAIVTVAEYFIASGDPDDAYVTGGDSGGPSFIVGNSGELLLSGVHWARGDDAERDENNVIITPANNLYSIDTAPAAYIDELNSLDGLTVTTSSNFTVVPVPEPSTSFLVGLAIMTLSFRRRRLAF